MQQLIKELKFAISNLVKSQAVLKAKLSLTIHKRPRQKIQNQAIFEQGMKVGFGIAVKKLEELTAKKELTRIKQMKGSEL